MTTATVLIFILVAVGLFAFGKKYERNPRFKASRGLPSTATQMAASIWQLVAVSIFLCLIAAAFL